jgi:hypothetical protein
LKRAGRGFRTAYPSYQDPFKPVIERKQRQAFRFARQFAPKTSAGLLVRNAESRVFDAPFIGELIVKRMFDGPFALPHRA